MNESGKPGEREQNGCNREWISRLVDGDLYGAELSAALDVMKDAEARDCWHLYQVIGDVLRAPESGVCKVEADFVERLRPHLHRDPSPGRIKPLPAVRRRSRSAANDGVFRWKLAASVASFAAVAAIGWSLLPMTRPVSIGQVADAGSADSPSPMHNAEFAPLLMAHWNADLGSPLGATRDFVRNTAYQWPDR